MFRKKATLTTQILEDSAQEKISKEQQLLEKFKQKTKNDKKIKLIRKIVQNQTKLHLKKMISKIPQEQELYRYMRNLGKLKKNILQPQFYATTIDTSKRKVSRFNFKSCGEKELKDYKIFSDTPLLNHAHSNHGNSNHNESLSKFRMYTENNTPLIQEQSFKSEKVDDIEEKRRKINELESQVIISPTSATKKKQQQQLRVITLQKRRPQQILPSVYYKKKQRVPEKQMEEQKAYTNFDDVINLLQTKQEGLQTLQNRLEPQQRRFHRKRKTLECEQFIREKFGFRTVTKEQFLLEKIKQEGVKEMQKNLNDRAQRQFKSYYRKKIGNQEEIQQQLKNQQMKFFAHAIENTTKSPTIRKIKFGTLNFLDQMESYLNFTERCSTAANTQRKNNIGGLMNDMKEIQSEILNYAQNLEASLEQEQSIESYLKEQLQETSAPVSPQYK